MIKHVYQIYTRDGEFVEEFRNYLEAEDVVLRLLEPTTPEGASVDDWSERELINELCRDEDCVLPYIIRRRYYV